MVKLKPRLENIVVVAPNEACLTLAQDFQAGMSRLTGSDVGVAMIIEAGPSRGADRYMHTHRPAAEREESRLDIVGEVAGAGARGSRLCTRKDGGSARSPPP